MGAGHNGCGPGTAEYEEISQQKKDDLILSEIDDARCQAYGATGSSAYLECRRRALAEQQTTSPRIPKTGTVPSPK
jgi:hypothetical protein